MSRDTVEIDGKGQPMTQRTDSLPCPHCNRAFCDCTPANRTGLTPGELERQRDELLDLLSDAWRDIFQTARANQTNLTGVDIITPEDEPIPELIGKHHVHQAGIDESLRLVERIKSAITSATKDKP